LSALRFSENCVLFVSATDPGVINLNIEPLLDALRGDPRFERLVGALDALIYQR
jgi:hypothetical protein